MGHGDYATQGVVLNKQQIHAIGLDLKLAPKLNPSLADSRSVPAGLLIDDTGASVRVWDVGTGNSTEPLKGLKAAIGRVGGIRPGLQVSGDGRQ